MGLAAGNTRLTRLVIALLRLCGLPLHHVPPPEISLDTVCIPAGNGGMGSRTYIHGFSMEFIWLRLGRNALCLADSLNRRCLLTVTANSYMVQYARPALR